MPMPRQVLEYSCLLISPGDVVDERDAIVDSFNKWNGTVGKGLDARLTAMRWEDHAVSDMSKPPQDVINAQLVESADLGIAVFWSRLGSPTADHESGSAEEIARLLQRGARVLLYHKKAPVPQAHLVGDQYVRLQEILKRYKQQGLLVEFETAEDLAQRVLLDITTLVAELAGKDRGSAQPAPTTGRLTAPLPDIRVHARQAFAVSPVDERVDGLGVTVENHSPVPYYHSGISFELDDGQNLWFVHDMVGRPNESVVIAPGDSFSLVVALADIVPAAKGRRIVCAISTSKIGHVFRSDPEKFPDIK